MTDNKKSEASSNAYSGSFSGFTGGIGNTGQVTGSQTANIHNVPKIKYCINRRNCKANVTHKPNDCYCWEEVVCTYCGGDDNNVQKCICLEEWRRKEQKPIEKEVKSDQKSETSNQLIISQKESQEISNKSVNEFSTGTEVNNQEILNKVSEFLKAKLDFLDARQEIINQIYKCWKELEKSTVSGKHFIIGEVGNIVSNTGSAVGAITFGIPKAVGEIVLASNNFSKTSSFKKNGKEFQAFLVNDENELNRLEKNCNLLESVVSDEQENLKPAKGKASGKIKFFGDNEYKIFDVLVNDKILFGKVLELEKMKEVIISLKQNLGKLWENLDQRFEELEKDKGLGKTFIDNLVSDRKGKILPRRIELKKTELEELIKNKTLKSKKQEKNDKRHELFEELWKANSEDELASFKENFLKTKDNWDKDKKVVSLVDKICQKHKEIIELQVELENLQKNQQQTQVVHNPPRNN